MEMELLENLVDCETDVDGVMRRFSGNERLYLTCLNGFLEDQTMNELEEAIKAGAWDEAFTAAHALKGLAGNMGFVPLFHATAKLVILIRAGKLREVDASFREMQRCYAQVSSAIRGSLRASRKGEPI